MRTKLGFLACLVCLWGTLIGLAVCAYLFLAAALFTFISIITFADENYDDDK